MSPSQAVSVARASNLSALGRLRIHALQRIRLRWQRGARAPHAARGHALASPGGRGWRLAGRQLSGPGALQGSRASLMAGNRTSPYTTRRTYPHIEERRSTAFGCCPPYHASMQRKTWARTRSAHRGPLGRTWRSPVFKRRKARSTAARLLYTRPVLFVRISRIAGEHLDRHWAARRVAPQPKHNLHLALFAVAAVPKPGQWTGVPFEIGRGDVAQDQRSVSQVPGGERGFALGVSGQQPIHCDIQGIRVCHLYPQGVSQAGGGGVGP